MRPHLWQVSFLLPSSSVLPFPRPARRQLISAIHPQPRPAAHRPRRHTRARMVSSATASGLRARADRPRPGSTSTRSPRTATRPSQPAARTTPACSPPSSAFTGSSGTRSRARGSTRTASSSPGSRRVGHHRCSLPRFRQADLTPQPHRAGCATALLSALSYPARLGGVACLSGWLPLSDRIQRDRGNRTSHPVGQVAVLPHCEAELTLLSLSAAPERVRTRDARLLEPRDARPRCPVRLGLYAH